ncbi:MAG: DUF1697 domain-containing protein [Rhizobiaceae bacterium]|nr:DUF1697 domain-containing protein [Rhizobiaceae bacterium]
MTVFIVLFRGVGGATQLPVKQLREVLTAAGFENVSTYINSGNAVAKTSLARDKATKLIADVCRREMGFEKDILLVAERDWARAIAANPFAEAVKVPTSIHLFALSAEPKPEAVEALKARKQPSESLHVSGTFMYFHAPDGFGPSKTPPIIDRTLGVVTTARNWNTVLKMQELAKAAR